MRPRIFLMALGVFLLVAASAQAGPLFSPTNTRTVDIHFTGYPDGATFTINYQTGVVVGYRTGGPDWAIWGSVGTVLNGTYRGGAVMLTDAGWGYHVVIADNPKKWVYYYPDGSIMNAGSWHLGLPDGAQGAGLSGVK